MLSKILIPFALFSFDHMSVRYLFLITYTTLSKCIKLVKVHMPFYTELYETCKQSLHT
jgi:hypothetical protein